MIGLFLFLLVPPTVTAKAVPESIRLSDTTTVTLTVEGDAPISATTGDWLADESAMSWRIKRIGQANVTPLSNGRERWSLELQIEPDLPGKPVALQLRPQSFRFGSNASPQMLEWPTLSIEVTTQAKADAGDARLITGIEAVPDPPPWNWRPVVVVFAVNILLFAIGLAVLLRRDFRRADPKLTYDWLRQQLTDLESEANPTQQAAGITSLLRHYVALQYGLITDCRTTAETEAEVLASANIPSTFDRVEFARLLNDCDRVKFDPVQSTPVDLLARCRAWIASESTTVDAGNRS